MLCEYRRICVQRMQTHAFKGVGFFSNLFMHVFYALQNEYCLYFYLFLFFFLQRTVAHVATVTVSISNCIKLQIQSFEKYYV